MVLSGAMTGFEIVTSFTLGASIAILILIEKMLVQIRDELRKMNETTALTRYNSDVIRSDVDYLWAKASGNQIGPQHWVPMDCGAQGSKCVPRKDQP